MTAIPPGIAQVPAQLAQILSAHRRRGLVVDYYCGGGGASQGLHEAGWSVSVAINHDEDAIVMHQINHPETMHVRDDVWNVDPHRDLPSGKIALAWFSPSCTHFSRAKGSKTLDNQTRALPWVAVALAKERAPRVIMLENVPEFVGWGPLGDDNRPLPGTRGDTFRQFVWRLETLGYSVDWRVLSAHHYGAPTTRKRLYLVARRDGEPIVWPERTHGPGLLPYRTAAECISWDEGCSSIFDRKKPLAEKTQARIAEGMRRFVFNGAPFVVGDAAWFGVQRSYGERVGQTPRTLDLHKPLGTVVAGGAKHALVCAWIVKHFGGVYGHGPGQPLGAITVKDHHSLAVATLGNDVERSARVAAFLTKFYGTSTGSDLRSPMGTVTATGQHLGLVTVQVDGIEHAVVDIGMRMLTPRELFRAQGFPDSYVLTGTKTSQIARGGNSVCPIMSKRLAEVNLQRKRKAA